MADLVAGSVVWKGVLVAGGCTFPGSGVKQGGKATRSLTREVVGSRGCGQLMDYQVGGRGARSGRQKGANVTQKKYLLCTSRANSNQSNFINKNIGIWNVLKRTKYI